MATETANHYSFDDGQFQLVWSGDGSPTSLVAHFSISGNATFSTDYSVYPGVPDANEPDRVLVTLDTSSLNVMIFAHVDAVADPGETVTLTLLPSPTNDYAVGSYNSLTFTILDDTVLPVVTVSSPDSTAEEEDANGTPTHGSFTVSRTGDTTHALSVGLTYGGQSGTTAATSGVDYVALPASVTIPAG